MTYTSTCCGVRPVRGTILTFNDYDAGAELQPGIPLPDPVEVHYSTCSQCKKGSQFTKEG